MALREDLLAKLRSPNGKFNEALVEAESAVLFDFIDFCKREIEYLLPPEFKDIHRARRSPNIIRQPLGPPYFAITLSISDGTNGPISLKHMLRDETQLKQAFSRYFHARPEWIKRIYVKMSTENYFFETREER